MTFKPDFPLDQLPGDFPDFVKNSGCAVIRNAIPAGTIQSILELAKQAYEARDWQNRVGQLPDSLRQPGMYPAGHIFLSDLNPGPDQGNFVLKNIINPDLLDLISDLTGQSPAFVISNCLPRRQKCSGGPNPPVPFHQDGSFLPGIYFNFWIPLIQVNVDAPGLEVVITDSEEIIAPGNTVTGNSIYDRIELPVNVLEEKFGEENFWHPVLEPGDILVLTHRTIHRTYWLDNMNRDRISLEIRFANAADTYLQKVLVKITNVLE